MYLISQFVYTMKLKNQTVANFRFLERGESEFVTEMSCIFVKGEY